MKLLSRRGLLIIVGILAVVGLAVRLYLTLGFETKPEFGGTYTEGVAGSPKLINPLFSHFNYVDRDLVSLIFSGLTTLDKGGVVVPDLAEGWNISQDGRSYTFNLRRGVKWHDGQGFSADDVIATINAAKASSTDGLPDFAELWNNASADKVDDYSVRLTLKTAFSPFLAYTTSLSVLPAHRLKNLSPNEISSPSSSLNSKPIGTGPFMFKDASLQHVLLEANPDYYSGQPGISQINMRFYPDYQSALSALERKEVQGVFLRPDIDKQDLTKLRDNKELELYSAQGSSYELLLLNLTAPFFKEVAVRQAILYAIDRQKLIDTIMGGMGMVVDSPVLPNTWAYNSKVNRYPYDPEKAKSILEAAGWTMGPDGARQKDGMKLQFSVLTNNDEDRIKMGEEIVRQLRRVGIRPDLTVGGLEGIRRDYLVPHKFHAIISGFDLGYDPDAYSLWHSSQIKSDGFNFASFSDARADEFLEKARQTTDQNERQKLYAEFQNLFAETVPSTLLYSPSYVYAVNKGVKGIDLGVLFEPSYRFAKVTEWYLGTKRVSKLRLW